MAKKERAVKLKLIDKIFNRANESTIGTCTLCAGQILFKGRCLSCRADLNEKEE